MAQTPKATRQYVMLAPWKVNPIIRREIMEVVCVSNPGEPKEDFVARTSHRYGRFFVTLSVAKRSYSKAWREYQESQEQAQCK